MSDIQMWFVLHLSIFFNYLEILEETIPKNYNLLKKNFKKLYSIKKIEID
jgi:hypothetical protein